MLKIRVDGSFAKPNHLRIPDKGPPFNSGKFAIEQGFKHHRVTPVRQRANGEANVFKKTINKTEHTTAY